jgi:acyl-CoA thioester hydrolase
MKSEDGETIHAVLWLTVIYFNMKTRKSDVHPEDTKRLFERFLVNLEEKDFKERTVALRKQNKKANLS